MRHASSYSGIAALLALGLAPGAEEKTRVLCDPVRLTPDTACVEDSLEVVFTSQADPARDSILEYDAFEKGREFEARIVTEVVSEGIQGWSYGVAHDTAFLEILSVTTEGTDVPRCPNSFNATYFTEVDTCGADPECSQDQRAPGGGFISAWVTFCGKRVDLPMGRRVIARASYRLRADPGVEGTLLAFSDRLAAKGSPRLELSLTVLGRNSLWTTAIDGWIKRAEEPASPRLFRGDANDDGEVDIADPIWTVNELARGGRPSSCPKAADSNDDGDLDIADAIYTIGWLFLGGPRLPPPFPGCGADPTADGLPCPAARPGCERR